ncbi:MAG: hypothetical protein SGARI_006077 [Bacillariaceae sp.]
MSSSKKRASDHSISSPSHFKGVVSLSPAAISPLPETGHDTGNEEQVALAPTSDTLLPDISATPSTTPSLMNNNPQDDSVDDDYQRYLNNLQPHSQHSQPADLLGSPNDELPPYASSKNRNNNIPVSSVTTTPVTTNVRSRKKQHNSTPAIKRKRRRHRKDTPDLASVPENSIDIA